ncbi:MAG: flagellar biosynthetic protein FliR [Deltaproteobacteria bacterium]|nr:flagellar biosynthetic protein FliR [Deltaproteobacteria bacterium]
MPDFSFLNVKFCLIFFRVLSILWFIPLLSSRLVSMMFKAGFSLIVSFGLFENVAFEVQNDASFSLVGAVLKEILLGLTIGFVVRIVFSSISAAGEILSIQTGLGFARYMDPTMVEQVSVIDNLKKLLGVIIFFAVDAHHILVRALYKTFEQIPIGLFTPSPPLFGFITEFTGKIFVLSLKIGAPLVVILFMVELMLGLLSRMVPQINIFIEGLPVKILIAMVILSLSLSFTVPYLGNLFLSMDKDIAKLIRMM